MAVSVKLSEAGPTGVRFLVQDLTQPDAAPQIAEVAHTVTTGVKTELPLVIGGRTGTDRHFWDGMIDEVRISRTAVSADELKSGAWTATQAWTFEGDTSLAASAGDHPLEMTPGESQADPAFVDFCHVLLNSNEFLYVD